MDTTHLPAKPTPAATPSEERPLTTPSYERWQSLQAEMVRDTSRPIETMWVIPRSLNSDELATLRSVKAELEAAVQPAGVNGAAKHVSMMRAFYSNSFRWKDMSADELSAVAYLWAKDLRDYPEDLIELAFDKWRRRAKSNGQPPGDVGELMKSVDPILAARKSQVWRVSSVLAISQHGEAA